MWGGKEVNDSGEWATRLKNASNLGTPNWITIDKNSDSSAVDIGYCWNIGLPDNLLLSMFLMWAESDRKETVKWFPFMLYQLLINDHDFGQADHSRFCEVLITEAQSFSAMLVEEYGIDYQYILSRCCEQVFLKSLGNHDAYDVACSLMSIKIILVAKYG
jgi:hypothetical protein